MQEKLVQHREQVLKDQAIIEIAKKESEKRKRERISRQIMV